MAERALFELEAVGVDYRTPAGVVTGVHEVSMDIPACGVTVLAGPSGSGKSTLLRVLGLFERPTRGVLRHDGADTARLTHARRRALRRDRLGLVFQQPPDNLLGHLTVAENLHAAAQSAGRVTDPAAILDRLGLAGTGDWAVTALSGGQQQRLAFGCVLARGSGVVIADEPTSQLDEASADRVLDTLRMLAADGVSVLVASHDDRVLALGDRVARLSGGQLSTVDTGGAS